jgi:hypothetical protein
VTEKNFLALLNANAQVQLQAEKLKKASYQDYFVELDKALKAQSPADYILHAKLAMYMGDQLAKQPVPNSQALHQPTQKTKQLSALAAITNGKMKASWTSYFEGDDLFLVQKAQMIEKCESALNYNKPVVESAARLTA